jgi:hypothetical protein
MHYGSHNAVWLDAGAIVALDRDVEVSDQTRLTKVMLLLVVAMVAGALVLLALEGKPIQPMPFSLASQAELTALQTAMGTETGVEPGRWQRIEVSYRDAQVHLSGQGSLAGELALRYHFVISPGPEQNDGKVFASHRWTQQLACLNPQQGTYDSRTIRVCVLTPGGCNPIGTARQNGQLEALISHLVRFCQIKPGVVWNRG